MRDLFRIDTKDYDMNGTVFSRPSSRAIIIKNNKVAMVHSEKFNFYKFPGGGIDKGETNIEALIRETKEEAGLKVIPSSIKEFGHVYRIQKGEFEDVFIQNNYYYLCEVTEELLEQKLEDYEEAAQFRFCYVDADIAIEANRKVTYWDKLELEREARVLEILKEEGYIK